MRKWKNVLEEMSDRYALSGLRSTLPDNSLPACSRLERAYIA